MLPYRVGKGKRRRLGFYAAPVMVAFFLVFAAVINAMVGLKIHPNRRPGFLIKVSMKALQVRANRRHRSGIALPSGCEAAFRNVDNLL
jgi:hypothetical protein